jgi:hypothetical protein
MSFDARIVATGGTSALVDSNQNLQVNLPTTEAQAGYAILAAESDDGTVTGTRVVRQASLSEQNRLRVGFDTVLFNEGHFNNVLNSSQWNTPVTTNTVTVSNGNLTLTGTTTASAVCRASSWRHFNIPMRAPLTFEAAVQFSLAPQANNTVEWGFGVASGVTAPTDGAFFRLTTTGTFICVLSFNGTETVSANLTAASLIPVNTTHDCQITFNDDEVEYFIDGVRVAKLARQTAAPSMTIAQNLPIFFRNLNAASGPAGIQVMKIGVVSVLMGDVSTGKPFSHIQSGAGLHGTQGQVSAAASYAVPATTAVYSNSLATATGTAATNTAAIATGIGLGGQVVVLPTLTAATDGIIFSYQNPAGTATQPGRNLYVNGVSVSGVVTVALTGGPLYYVWSVAYGHTAVSLATAEASNTATPTKAPRRVPFGISTTVVTAAIGTAFGPVTLALQTPICVQPGEFFQICAKNIGTVTTLGAVTMIGLVDSYWE